MKGSEVSSIRDSFISRLFLDVSTYLQDGAAGRSALSVPPLHHHSACRDVTAMTVAETIERTGSSEDVRSCCRLEPACNAEATPLAAGFPTIADDVLEVTPQLKRTRQRQAESVGALNSGINVLSIFSKQAGFQGPFPRADLNATSHDLGRRKCGSEPYFLSYQDSSLPQDFLNLEPDALIISPKNASDSDDLPQTPWTTHSQDDLFDILDRFRGSRTCALEVESKSDEVSEVGHSTDVEDQGRKRRWSEYIGPHMMDMRCLKREALDPGVELESSHSEGKFWGEETAPQGQSQYVMSTTSPFLKAQLCFIGEDLTINSGLVT